MNQEETLETRQTVNDGKEQTRSPEFILSVKES